MAAASLAAPHLHPGALPRRSTLENYHAATVDEWHQHTDPEARRLDAAVAGTTDRAQQLRTEDRFNQRWHHEHPEHAARIRQLETAVADLDRHIPPPGASAPARSRARQITDHLEAARFGLNAANAALEAQARTAVSPPPLVHPGPESPAADQGIDVGF